LPKKSDDFIFYAILKGKGSANSTKHKEKDKKKTTATSSCHSRPTNLREFYYQRESVLANHE